MNDLEFLASHGIDEETFRRQMSNYKSGFAPIRLLAPATVGHGILALDDDMKGKALGHFERLAPGKRLMKFVPASGAASRMFKSLYAFSSTYFGVAQNFEKQFPEVKVFLENIHRFAFFEDLKGKMQDSNLDIEDYMQRGDYSTIINYLLQERYMAYGILPKALLKFHRYGSIVRTPLEEHLVEGAEYARDANNVVRLHFTVSPAHRKLFVGKLARVRAFYEQALGVRYKIGLSEQDPATDIVSVDEQNQPLRDDDGNLVLRPGGHGALLRNLERLDADVIYVKNIDNVAPDWGKHTTVVYKKVLAGLLLRLQETNHKALHDLRKGNVDASRLAEIERFAAEELGLDLGSAFAGQEVGDRRLRLLALLDRPMRVCGMVRNQGEPGGGPFWVRDDEGRETLQIVESTQVNRNDPQQEAIMQKATHFNPVDLVCAIRDERGRRYKLDKFVDVKTGFITKKSAGAKVLKSQELPGLWNGSMAGWITLLVEVPLATFNPVKTVNDLLREEHQEN